MIPPVAQLFKLADVDLDFARGWYRNRGSEGPTLADYVTTSRASTGYADTTSGLWLPFANNVARQTDKGLLVEEARTNSIRNNSMQGAVAGSPGTLPTNWTTNEGPIGGLTRTISLGTTNGIEWIELNYTGTPATTGAFSVRNEPTNQTAAASGQTWTYSVFVANSSSTGVTNVRTAIAGNNDAGTQQEAFLGTIFSGAAWVRQQQTATLAVGTTTRIAADIRCSVTSGTPINYTLRIGWPQLELGSWASSPIRTTSAAVTRAADVITLTSAPTFGSVFSMVGIGTPQAPAAYAQQQYIAQIDDGGTASRLAMLRRPSTGNAWGYISTGGVPIFDTGVSGAVWAQNTSGTLAVGGQQANHAAVFNGGTPLTGTNVTAMPVVNTVRIGNSTGTGLWNGYISRLGIWPTTRLPTADLQKVTGGAVGAITPAAMVLDAPNLAAESQLDNALYALDGTGSVPVVINGSGILAELQAYTLFDGPQITLYYGSDGYNDPTAPAYYEGRMVQPLSYRRDIFSGNTTGGAGRVSFGEMRLGNDDGDLDGLRTTYAFAGWPARQLIGDINQPYNTWEILITGKPQQVFFSYSDVAITFRDRLQDFAQAVQTTKYKGDNILPNGLEGLTDIKDRPKPLLYGRVLNIAPVCCNTAKLIYQVNDGRIEDLAAVYDKGVLLTRGPDYVDSADMIANQPEAGTYRAWMAGGYFRLGASPSGTITCDAADRIALADNTAAQVALRIASRPPESGEGGITDADVNWSDVSELDRKNPATVGIWIADETQFNAALDAVLGSIGAWYGFDRFSMFRMQRHEVPSGQGVAVFKRFGPDVDAALGEFDIVGIRFLPTNDPDRGVPTHEVKIDYALNHTVQPADGLAGEVSADRRNFLGLQYRTAVASTSSVLNAYPLAMKKQLTTLLLNQADAEAEAQRVLQLYVIQRDFIEIDAALTSDLTAMIDIGSEVRVQLPRFQYTAGKPMRITGMQYNALGRRLTLALWG